MEAWRTQIGMFHAPLTQIVNCTVTGISHKALTSAVNLIRLNRHWWAWNWWWVEHWPLWDWLLIPINCNTISQSCTTVSAQCSWPCVATAYCYTIKLKSELKPAALQHRGLNSYSYIIKVKTGIYSNPHIEKNMCRNFGITSLCYFKSPC